MKVLKCEICGKKATKRFSPDMDIVGIGSCTKHLDDMIIAYMILIQEGMKPYEDFIKSLKST